MQRCEVCAAWLILQSLVTFALPTWSQTPEQLVAILSPGDHNYATLEIGISGCGASYEQLATRARERRAYQSIVAAGDAAVPALEVALAKQARARPFDRLDGIGYLMDAYAAIRGKAAEDRLLAIQRGIAPEILGSSVDHALAIAHAVTSVISYHRRDIAEFCRFQVSGQIDEVIVALKAGGAKNLERLLARAAWRETRNLMRTPGWESRRARLAASTGWRYRLHTSPAGPEAQDARIDYKREYGVQFVFLDGTPCRNIAFRFDRSRDVWHSVMPSSVSALVEAMERCAAPPYDGPPLPPNPFSGVPRTR